MLTFTRLGGPGKQYYSNIWCIFPHTGFLTVLVIAGYAEETWEPIVKTRNGTRSPIKTLPIPTPITFN